MYTNKVKKIAAVSYTHLDVYKRQILVGRHTALLDKPALSTRNCYGKHPVRLVIDKELTLPRDLELFNGKIKTFVFTRE